MELINSKTYENLKKAFVSECAARTRYEFVEYGQRNGGYEGLAQITDEIAYQEFNHARMLYTKIESATKGTIDNEPICVTLPFRERWDIVKNLKHASEDEKDEAEFYKKAAKTAEEEGFTDIANLFSMIATVELKHSKIFMHLHEKLEEGTLYKNDSKKRWTCPACGYETTSEEAFDECPLCKAKMETVKVDLPNKLML